MSSTKGSTNPLREIAEILAAGYLRLHITQEGMVKIRANTTSAQNRISDENHTPNNSLRTNTLHKNNGGS